jgi:hypothetical protein
MAIVGKQIEPEDMVDAVSAMAVYRGEQEQTEEPKSSAISPSWGAFGAGIREMPVLQFGSAIGRAVLPDDPTFEHPWHTLDEKYDAIAPQLAKAGSLDEWYQLISTYNLKLQDRAYMQDQGVSGYAAYMAGAVSDPIVLGAAIATAPLVGVGEVSYGAAAARMGAATTAEATAAEAVLQLVDPYRTFDESAINILAAGALGSSLGLIGTAASKALGPTTQTQLADEIRQGLKAQALEIRNSQVAMEYQMPIGYGQSVRLADDGESLIIRTPEGEETVPPDEIAARLEELQAELDAPQYLRPLDEPPGVGSDISDFTTIKEETPIFNPSKGHTDIIQSPLTRNLYNGISASQSRFMDVLVRHNYLKETSFNGKAPLTKQNHATLQDEISFAESTFFREMTDQAVEAKEVLKKRNIKMHETEIAVEAGRAARRGDKHHIPEIQAIAENFRASMRDWGQRLNEQGLLSDEALADVDKYFPRIYDLNRIMRHWERWETLIARHFAQKYPELDVLELRQIADDIFNTLNGNPVNRPYPTKIKVRKNLMKSGHLKSRRLDIDDINLEEFLVDDIRVVARRYAKGVAPDLLLREIFGKDNITVVENVPVPSNWWNKIIDEWSLAQKHELAKNTKEGNIKASALKEQQKKAEQDVLFILSELTGHNNPTVNSIRGMSLDFARSKFLNTVLGGAKGYTASAALGNMVLAALPDGANTILYAGLRSTIKAIPATAMAALPKTISNNGKRWLRAMNVGLDRLDHRRMAAIADIEEYGMNPTVWDDPNASFGQKMKESLRGQNVANTAFKYMGANIWNASLKTLDGFALQDRFITDFRRWGKLREIDKAMYARLGVTEEMANKFVQNWNAQPKKTHFGVRVADLDSWDNSAAARWSRLIYRETEEMVVKPEAWERPISINNEIGGFVAQFKGFMQSHVVKHLSNAGQRLSKGDRRAYEFIMAAWTLAIMGDTIKQIIKHNFDLEETGKVLSKRTLADWIFLGIDRGALSGFGTDLFLGFDGMSKGKISESMGMSQRKYYTSQGLGLEQRVPGLGYVSNIAKSSSALFQQMTGVEQFTAKDLHRMRMLMPLQNLFYLAWLFDISEEAMTEAFNLPEETRRRKKINYGG